MAFRLFHRVAVVVDHSAARAVVPGAVCNRPSRGLHQGQGRSSRVAPPLIDPVIDEIHRSASQYAWVVPAAGFERVIFRTIGVIRGHYPFGALGGRRVTRGFAKNCDFSAISGCIVVDLCHTRSFA